MTKSLVRVRRGSLIDKAKSLKLVSNSVVRYWSTSKKARLEIKHLLVKWGLAEGSLEEALLQLVKAILAYKEK